MPDTADSADAPLVDESGAAAWPVQADRIHIAGTANIATTIPPPIRTTNRTHRNSLSNPRCMFTRMHVCVRARLTESRRLATPKRGDTSIADGLRAEPLVLAVASPHCSRDHAQAAGSDACATRLQPRFADDGGRRSSASTSMPTRPPEGVGPWTAVHPKQAAERPVDRSAVPDWRRTGVVDASGSCQVLGEDQGGSVECVVGFVELADERLEDVRNAYGDVEDDIDVGFSGAFGEPDRIVQQEFVRADLQQYRREAGQIGVHRGGGVDGLRRVRGAQVLTIRAIPPGVHRAEGAVD